MKRPSVRPISEWEGSTEKEAIKKSDRLWVLFILLSIRTRERLCEHDSEITCYRNGGKFLK